MAQTHGIYAVLARKTEGKKFGRVGFMTTGEWQVLSLARLNKGVELDRNKQVSDRLTKVAIFALVGIMSALWIMACCVVAGADEYTIDQLADSIYMAEGGSKTNHPYGILKKYKTTTPRQACINTIYSAIKVWDGECDFVEHLGFRYCPIGAANDPMGLNKNWVKNVKFFLNRFNKEARHEARISR